MPALRRFGILLSIAAVACIAAPAPAGAEASGDAVDPAVALSTAGRGYEQLVQVWRLRRAAVEDGDAERADELVERVLRLRGETGIQRLDAFAVALLREVFAAARAGDWDTAAARLAQAERLSPGLPEVWEARGAVALMRQPLALHRWLDGEVRALRARIGDLQRRMLWLSDGLLTLLLVLGGVGLLTLVAQLVRYGLHLYHDLGQAFPAVMKFLLLAAAGLLLLLPLVFGFGPILFYFPIAVLLWAYQSRGERGLAILFTLLLGAAPWLLRIGDRLTEAGTGVTQALHALSLNAADPRALAAAEGWLAEHPDDWQALAVTGLTYKRLGRLDDAARLLRAAAEGAPPGAEAGVVQNNLANAYFAAGRAKSAELAYDQARKHLPDEPGPLFNLHRLYQRTGRADLASPLMAQASKLDAQRVAAWTESDTPTANQFVVDLDLPATSMTRRAAADLLAPTDLSHRAWLTLAGPVPAMGAPIGAAMTLLLFGVLTALQPRLRLTWPCGRCGRPATVFLAQGRPDRPQCDQCLNLFVRNVPVDRRVRFEKEEAIERHEAVRRWATRIGGAVVPGLAGLARGRPVRGALVAAAALTLLIWLLSPEGLLIEPVRLPEARTSITAWAAGVALVALWVMSVLRAFRWPEDDD